MIRKTRVALLAVVGFIVIAAFLWQAGFLSHRTPLEKVAVGSSVNPMNGLLYIAKEKGFDRARGLELDIKPYQTGRDTLRDLIAGRLDVALGAEFILIKEIYAGAAFNVRCLSVICSGEVDRLIACRDHGISRPEDLMGKTIGLAKNTQAEFFLGRFLTLNSIPLKEVTIVDVNPFDQPEALATGRVDAVLAWEPNAFNVLEKIGNNGIAWPAQGGQDFYWLLMSRKEIIKQKSAVLERMLDALNQAAKFFQERPAEAMAIISQWTKVSLDDLQKLALPKRYGLFLDQGLLLAMEDQAAWMIENRRTDQTMIPNFMDYLDPGPLLQVNPKAVQLALPGKVAGD
jgi:ABC-type nitrate/sulfonate/bicarbonate transport system substrate-binding protein